MSTSSAVALGALRLQAQQRSDMINNNAISIPEWNSYLTQSRKELYDILISAYGNDYSVATTFQFITTNANQYPLPDGSPSFLNSTGGIAARFYKLLGVDLQYSASPTGYVSLQRFEFIERNKYAYPNTATNFNGYTNLKYRIEDNNIFLIPLPQSGQQIQLWYIPTPNNLQFILPCGIMATSATLTLSDVTGLSAGMNVYGTGIQANATILTINSTTNTLVISFPAVATNVSAILSFWNDSTLLEGISGWEEYVIVDSCIKAKIKQEEDYSGFVDQKLGLKARIEAMAEGRDAGQAHHVSDALSVQSFGAGNGNGMDGWGDGY